jgi:hypothetical protein
MSEAQILWSMSTSSYDSMSSLVPSQSFHPLVDEVVVPMQSSADPTPLFGGDAPLDHVFLHFIHPVVEEVVVSMQSSVDPTPLLWGDAPLDHVWLQPF